MSLFSHDDMSDKERIKALEAHVLALEARIVALDDRLDLDVRRLDAQITAQQRAQPAPSLWTRVFRPGASGR